MLYVCLVPASVVYACYLCYNICVLLVVKVHTIWY